MNIADIQNPSSTIDTLEPYKKTPTYFSQRESFSLSEIKVPSNKEENWRFTPFDKISDLFKTITTMDNDLQVQISPIESVQIEVVARDDQRLGQVGMPRDRTSVVAWHVFQQAHIVTIPTNIEVIEPIVINIKGNLNSINTNHILVQVKENASAVIIINHQGSGKLNQTVEIDVADNATLNIISLQEWNADAIHISNHRIKAGHGSIIKHIVVTLGGELVRLCVDAKLEKSRSDINILGAYFVDSHQHLEHRVFVAHQARDCKSRVSYKGALQGAGANAVWVGDCLIDKDGYGTDTYELNRNLVLTEGTKVHSVPNLEIKNGEIVGAGHASTTGRFDDDQLFYLMARGISKTAAMNLIVKGFFAELINQIDIPTVQEHLLDIIDTELQLSVKESNPQNTK